MIETTEKTPLPPEETVEEPPSNEKEENSEGGRSFQFWIIASIGGSIGLCLLLFLVAMGAGTISGRWENVATLITIIRDLMIIFLVLEAILIGVALIVMIVQLSALVNLLQNEIEPIVQNTQQATQTVKGTAQFISTRVTKPVIRTYASLAGLGAFVKELRLIRRATKPNGQNRPQNTPVIAEGELDE